MSHPAWESLSWDSGFFGFPTARLLDPGLGPSDMARALDGLAGKGVRLVYWAADPGNAAGAEAAIAAGGFLADTRLTFRLDVKDPAVLSAADSPPESPAAWAISPFQPEDSEPALLGLSLRAGLHSRFQADPRFPPALFRSLYEEWMRKSLAGKMADAVLVAREDGALAGMVTVSARSGEGSIGLIAVAARCEGRGLGSALVRAAGHWLGDRGCGSVQVVTQERNAAACALYGKQGFRLIGRRQLWHFWLGSP